MSGSLKCFNSSRMDRSIKLPTDPNQIWRHKNEEKTSNRVVWSVLMDHTSSGWPDVITIWLSITLDAHYRGARRNTYEDKALGFRSITLGYPEIVFSPYPPPITQLAVFSLSLCLFTSPTYWWLARQPLLLMTCSVVVAHQSLILIWLGPSQMSWWSYSQPLVR